MMATWVRSYLRRDGTLVESHLRNEARSTSFRASSQIYRPNRIAAQGEIVEADPILVAVKARAKLKLARKKFIQVLIARANALA